MDLAIEFAKQGLGLASVIHEFVEKDITAGLLHPILLKDPIPQREIGFVYLNNQLISEQMSDLISYYQTHKKEHPV